MIRRPPRSTQSRSSAASDVYKRQPPPSRGGRKGGIGRAPDHSGEPWRPTAGSAAALAPSFRFDTTGATLPSVPRRSGDPGPDETRTAVWPNPRDEGALGPPAKGDGRGRGGWIVGSPPFGAAPHALGLRHGVPSAGNGTCPPRRGRRAGRVAPVSYTHLRAHETRHDLVCRLLL